MSTPRRPPIVWAIAGLDSSGGAGLSADHRAADAVGVHLCPVAACITAQHSQGIEGIFPIPVSQLDAQLQALQEDLPPAAIKVGLLYAPELVKAVARWVDRLRHIWPDLPLIVDPVLGASAGGISAHHPELLQAFRDELLPRATVITPNRAEASLLLGHAHHHDADDALIPQLAKALLARGAQGVIITGGDAKHPNGAIDWMDLPHASGWLCAPRVASAHHHGTGCTFGSALAGAMAWGHTSADAAVMAKMVTHQAILDGHAAGHGAGPVMARATTLRAPMPWLGLHDQLPWQMTLGEPDAATLFPTFQPPADQLYGILPNGPMLAAAAEAGMHCVQLRHKAEEGVVDHIIQAMNACQQHGATLFINDHWRQALSVHRDRTLTLGIHLGQEDLMALAPADIEQLLQARHRVLLGISSHSLWELARALGCGPSLVACGPIYPTQTKDMPWHPQGADNLRWWIQHSPAPVVAIGGILNAAQLQAVQACHPAALCVVRALGQHPHDIGAALAHCRSALAQAHTVKVEADRWPHPML